MAVVSDEFLAKVEQFVASARAEVALHGSQSRINRSPGVCGGVACIGETRIAVWTLIGLKKMGRTESQLLQDFPSLKAADMDAVWAYYREHPAEIDASIAEEERED